MAVPPLVVLGIYGMGVRPLEAFETRGRVAVVRLLGVVGFVFSLVQFFTPFLKNIIAFTQSSGRGLPIGTGG